MAESREAKMTAREILEPTVRRMSQLEQGGLAILALGALLCVYSIMAVILVVVGLIVAFLTSAWAAMIIVCPRCKVSLAKLLGGLYFRPLRVFKEIHVCPFCRLELDAPFDESKD